MNDCAVFINALQRVSPEQRRQYHDAVCAGDEALRLGVESLLAAHSRAGNFLQEPVFDILKAGGVLHYPALVQPPAKLGRNHDTPGAKETSAWTDSDRQLRPCLPTEAPSLEFLAP